jgi:hypothetical protein
VAYLGPLGASARTELLHDFSKAVISTFADSLCPTPQDIQPAVASVLDTTKQTQTSDELHNDTACEMTPHDPYQFSCLPPKDIVDLTEGFTGADMEFLGRRALRRLERERVRDGNRNHDPGSPCSSAESTGVNNIRSAEDVGLAIWSHVRTALCYDPVLQVEAVTASVSRAEVQAYREWGRIQSGQ